MEEIKEDNGLEQTQLSEKPVIVIHNDPVMQSALDAISIFGKHKEITLRAKGNSIPNAVAVANIIIENLMKEKSKIQKISVDSEPIKEIGRTQSSIEIIINKI